MGYLIRSGYDQAQLIRDRVPIANILNDPEIPSDHKRKIRLIDEVRQFSQTQLGLTTTENYKTYVQLNRPYVTYIVQASPPYELDHYLWSFPIVGELPYKGFFNKDDAEAEARNLKVKNFDTMVRGVRAYSTLGWLKDPILSSMMDYKDWDLVNLIIHESTHATVYLKSSADFNEQLASFVAAKGTERFYTFKEGKDSPTLKLIQDSNQDEKNFSIFITEEIGSLKTWYANNRHDTTLKEHRLKEITDRFKKNILPKMKTKDYAKFSDSKLNNAVLMGYKVYSEDLGLFENAYQRLGADMKKFLEYCKELSHSSKPKNELAKISI